MKLTSLSISNYRALRDATIPLSRFGCLIGENTREAVRATGVVPVLLGTKLAADHFFDESKPIICSNLQRSLMRT